MPTPVPNSYTRTTAYETNPKRAIPLLMLLALTDCAYGFETLYVHRSGDASGINGVEIVIYAVFFLTNWLLVCFGFNVTTTEGRSHE